jgi:hypothetical protein
MKTPKKIKFKKIKNNIYKKNTYKIKKKCLFSHD